MGNHNHHTHEHHAHEHHAHHQVMYWTLFLTLSFATVEAVSGWFAGSLALMSDAGHMLADSAGLALAAFGMWVAHQPPSARYSFGFVRAEVLVALMNVVLLLVTVAWIAVEAVTRFYHPQAVAGLTVIVVAVLGLMLNIGIALLLHPHHHNHNVRAAFLHVLGDLLGSMAAIIAGVVVYYTGWTPIDPFLSLLISVLILCFCLPLLKECIHVLMQGVPEGITLEDVAECIQDTEGVLDVAQLHIWTLASRKVYLTAQIKIKEMHLFPDVSHKITHQLQAQFGISEVVLSPILDNGSSGGV